MPDVETPNNRAGTPLSVCLPLFGRNVSRQPRLVGGVKGHNMNETSFPGSPFDILRAVNSVERPRRACPVLTGWAASFTIL